ncbi:MAG TPA: carbon-nitrogen hydrolase family protein [Thermoanaerobaculia bacterium]|jgi:nitrilase|nr:carbon-nitrogen hydrolase family protein [Thermoanaerobaculia bacterium]
MNGTTVGDAAPIRIAAVQATPAFLQREATVARACELIHEAARQGARLVVFPEAFVPTYPLWVWHVPAGDSITLRALHAELVDQAVVVPGPVTERLGDAARAAGAAVAIGVNERNVEASGTSLFNTLLLFDEQGRLRSRHRKLVPTGGERLVHAPGDGSTLAVHDLGWAKLSGLVCWENYMPLARYALYAWGAEVHVAPTWDRGEPWLSTLRHIAKEGRVYVVGCCSAVRREDVPDAYAFKGRYLPPAAWVNPGDSAIVDPDGRLLAGPTHEEETILYAEVDLRVVRGARFQLDVAGHYARPDVFELRVRRQPRPLVAAAEDDSEAPVVG